MTKNICVRVIEIKGNSDTGSTVSGLFPIPHQNIQAQLKSIICLSNVVNC